VKSLIGTYKLEGDRLTLTEVTMKTGKTTAVAGGVVDINSETLDLAADLRTADVNDLASPYVDYLKGSAEFKGKISGTFDDPVLSGRANIADAMIKTYPAGNIFADVSYRKNLLQVRELTAGGQYGKLALSGNISFKGAKTLFDVSDPTWGLQAVLKDVDAGDFVKLFYPQFSGRGRFSATASLEGTEKLPDIRAAVSFDKAMIYNVPVDAASFSFRYAASKIDFTGITAKQGDSAVRGEFTIYPDDTFSYMASSDRIRLSDIIRRPLKGEVIATLVSEGKGTFDNPSITLEARMIEGVLRGKSVGSGVIHAALRNKEFTAKATLINDRITVSAKGRTDGVMPWEAAADVQTGRYDFLVTSVLKDVPEDLILNLNGHVSLSGNRDHVTGTAAVKHVVLSMYGYSFTNEEEINVNLRDREISLGRIAMRSGNTLLRATGSLNVGTNFNVTIEGSSALSPFKSLSAKLGVLKGDADFVVGISGDWERPRINGGITLVNGSIGLKEYPAQRITDLKGYLYMDNDRVVLQNLSGKIGGGDLDFSGILYLKRFAFSRFYVEARMKNVTNSISNEFSVNFDGSLLYKGTPEAQMISGNIDINRARYRERIEWKSWLLQTKKAETFKTDISNLAKADLNIKITGENNIIIDNNVARAVVGADMVLKGKIYRPSLLGRLETSEGKVFFRNNEFNILHASADFSDPNRLNPFISIAADTAVKGYRIKMNLEGQLDRFSMSLSSDPPLKEMDILALLTVGQTGSGVKGLEAGIGAGEATSFVTGKMQDVIEERLRSITGLDRFQVDPYVSKTTGTVEPRVTVSKRLLGDKVFVTYTTAVGTMEEQIIKLELFMSKSVSLVGVRDERGITGGDIRFRFEFK
jgi:translocation and assembly module TamB